MTIERIHIGPRMSAAVIHNGVVYLSGQVAHETRGQSVTAQTAEILKQIDALLAEAGADKSKLLTANIYLADLSTFPEMNAVWDAWVSPGNTPCRTTVGAPLATANYAVEIGVVAAV